MTETEYATNVQARFPRCFTAEGLANPAALAKRENAAMHRAIGQYRSSQREYVPPATDNENMAAAKAAIIAKGETTRGDILRVRLEVEAVGDMAWVVISDPVPAGATLLGGGLGRDSQIATQGERREGAAWPAYEEHAADAWRGYYEWLPRGRHVVEYTLRLNASGRFGLPPTRVEAMYAPETFGERPNEALEVVP